MEKKDATMTNVRIEDKEYPCRVTMGAMVRFKRKMGFDVSKLDPGDMEGLMAFIWCCVVSACHADSVEFDMDFEDFADRLTPVDISGFFGTPEDTTDGKKKMEDPSQ